MAKPVTPRFTVRTETSSDARGMSRRQLLLRGTAALALTAAAGGILAACGESSVVSTAPMTTAAVTAIAPMNRSGTPAAPLAATSGVMPASMGAPKKGGTIKAEINSDVANLDPLASSLLVDRQVLYNIYDSLVAVDRNQQIVPSLAQSWEMADPKTYVFHLRQGVTYHDDTPFDADSVKWNIERYLTDKKSLRGSEINSIQSVEVMDAHTVKFNLKAAFAPLLANLVDRAGMMISQKAVEAGKADFSRKPIGGGTGAFKFVEWLKDDHLTLERNANYWKKDASGVSLPYLDRVTIRPIIDETVALTNLKTGDIDVSHYLPAKDFASVKAGNELMVQATPGFGYGSVVLNVQAEPFNKKELRQAFAEALDRDEILKTAFFGVGQVAYGPFAPPNFAHDPAFKPYGANVARAKEYLAAGGKPNGFVCEMQIQSGSPATALLAQLMKDQVAKAGITMNLMQLDYPTIVANTQMAKYQAALSGWSGRLDPDGNVYNQLHTGSPNNLYSNPQVDDLIDRARVANEQAPRKELYQQAQKLIVDDAPLVYYEFPLAIMATRPNVQGMLLYPDQIMRFETGWLK